MNLYFFQKNAKSSSIYEGKIRYQIESFEDYINNCNKKRLFVVQDVSNSKQKRIYDTGSGKVVFYYKQGVLSSNISRFYNWYFANRRLYKKMLEYVWNHSVTHIYIRRSGTLDKYFIRFLRCLKKEKIKIIYDIPTFPYDCEMVKGSIQYKMDIKYRKQLKKYVDLIVTPSPQKNVENIFGVPYLIIPNGLIVDDIKETKAQVYKDNSIHAIAVSSLRSWHGFDRFIEGLGHYYNILNGNRNIVFHIVGGDKNNEYYKLYKSLVSKYGLERHIILYGNRYGRELDAVYDKCNIGISSLGLHRINIYKSTALKNGEYIARGIPVYSSTLIDIFPDDFRFAGYDEEGESPIDISKFIDFYDDIYSNGNYRVIHDEIRTNARNLCDMRKYMEPLFQWIDNN